MTSKEICTTKDNIEILLDCLKTQINKLIKENRTLKTQVSFYNKTINELNQELEKVV